MVRSPLVLAALATVAVPEIDAVDVRRSPHPGAEIDAAVVIGANADRWVIRAPQTSRAGADLEAEVALLEGLAPYVDAGDLPFEVPRLAGSAPLDGGGRAVVHRQLYGRPIRLEELGPGPGMAARLGQAIAAIHELPIAIVEDAGLPVYDGDTYRQRRLVELDEAAATGYVPTFLLRRWERALEDVSLWHFQPTVVHGDLSAEHVLCEQDCPVGVLGWADTKVADPADDLAWLLVAAPQAAVDPIVEAYHLRRTELRDPHLATRALLAGELAVARWLLHGVHSDDGPVIDDAREMLLELEEHLLRYEEAALAAAREAGYISEEYVDEEYVDEAEGPDAGYEPQEAAWEDPDDFGEDPVFQEVLADTKFRDVPDDRGQYPPEREDQLGYTPPPVRSSDVDLPDDGLPLYTYPDEALPPRRRSHAEDRPLGADLPDDGLPLYTYPDRDPIDVPGEDFSRGSHEDPPNWSRYDDVEPEPATFVVREYEQETWDPDPAALPFDFPDETSPRR